MGVNSLPKTVTRQRRGCDLNPGPSAPESSTLTTRLPSHPVVVQNVYQCEWSVVRRSVWWCGSGGGGGGQLDGRGARALAGARHFGRQRATERLPAARRRTTAARPSRQNRNYTYLTEQDTVSTFCQCIYFLLLAFALGASTLLAGRQEGHPADKKLSDGMVWREV